MPINVLRQSEYRHRYSMCNTLDMNMRTHNRNYFFDIVVVTQERSSQAHRLLFYNCIDIIIIAWCQGRYSWYCWHASWAWKGTIAAAATVRASGILIAHRIWRAAHPAGPSSSSIIRDWISRDDRCGFMIEKDGGEAYEADDLGMGELHQLHGDGVCCVFLLASSLFAVVGVVCWWCCLRRPTMLMTCACARERKHLWVQCTLWVEVNTAK